MKGLKTLLLLGVLSFGPAARADYVFTWHFIYPSLQRFQASFELTDAEMQPGGTFGSDLFRNSISIASPEGIMYHGNDPVWDDPTGQYGPPFFFALNLHDDSHSISLSAIGECDIVPPYYNGPNTLEGKIYEFFPSGNTVLETGWWSYQQIPEPSGASLLFLGTVAWLLKRKTALKW